MNRKWIKPVTIVLCVMLAAVLLITSFLPLLTYALGQ